MNFEASSTFGITRTFWDPKTKIWSGIKEPMDIDVDFDLGKFLIESLLKYPEKIGQICCDNGKEFTNQEIADYAISIACHLRKFGFQQGEVIGFVASNTEYVASFVIAALLNGLVINPIYTSFEKESIKHIFSITNPSIVFCDGSAYDRVRDVVGSKIQIFTISEHISGVPDITEFLNGPTNMDNFQPEPLKEGGKQTAFIVCSSGTTGLPKGICMSHEYFRARNINTYRYDERVLNYSSLYWISGIITLAMGIIAGSTRLISKNPFSVQEFFEIVKKFKPNVVFSGPSPIGLFLGSPNIHNYDLSCIKCYTVAGGALSPSLIAKFKSFLPNTKIIFGYGMSEIPGGYISLGLTAENNTAGKLANNVEMKIIDDDNNSLGPNEIGEILVRSNFKFMGYYGNAEETAAVYDEDGWIHSADMGYVNEDGNVFVVDRKKEILKYLNFHYSPTEIETVIMQIPDVVDVCVCGIPDEVRAFLPAALIVPKTGSNLTEDEVYKFVANKMDDFKHLRGGVFFVESIPKTPSGKNLRREVVDICKSLSENKKNE